MNKQQILELTGMSEDQFYDMYPDQESFCSDYPEACAQLEQAQGGMQVGITYDRSGNPVNISPDVTPSQWQTVDGMYTRPHTVDRFGRPIAPMTDVTTTPVSRVPFNREQPLDVISPLVARYTLPKGMVDNSKPIEKMIVPRQALSPKQTMYNVGSTGAPYSIPASKYSSIVDMLKAAGQDSSFTSRKELAKQLGINNYVGTAAQNMALMNALSGSGNNEMKYGGIHINPANKGKFTAWAKAHGMGVQEAASHVMANKEDYSPTIVKRANFAKNATKFKHEEGGELEQYQVAGQVNYNLPTTQDSLNVMNSQLKLNQFYDNERKLGRLKFNYKIPFRKKHSYSSNELNNKNLKFYRDAIKLRQDYNDSGYDEEYKKLFNLSPSDVSRLEYQGLDKTKSGNNNVQYYRDLVTPLQNLASPFAMYDDRIEPQNIISYDPFTGNETRYPGGLVTLYDYDPIVVKPAAMKTQADWAYVKKNYPDLYNNQNKQKEKINSSVKSNVNKEKQTLSQQLSVVQKPIDQPQTFPTTKDTFITVLDPEQRWYLNDANVNKQYKKEQGGDVFPAMRNFKHGGYYGMDQKFHPNSDSGTYVGGAGYYFQPGGTATSASAPGTSGGVDVSGVPGAGAFNPDNSFAGDQFSDMSGLYGNDPFGVGNQAYGEEGYAGNPYDESQQSMAYDPSQYSSEIDPSTGFVKYKKNGMALTKIKRQDPALWQHLKEQGHGARWETGQTDIQRIGRTAGKIGEGLEAGINVAGAIGNYLSNRQKQQNLDKSAMNKGSTASMFTNPEGSGKGDYGVTGSAYGMFKPNQMGNYSFKGMYGKYGMEVPKYAVGGFEPQIETLADYGLNKSIKDIDVPINYESLYALPSIPRDNTRVAPPIIPLDVRQKEIDYNNLKSSPLPNPNGKDVATKLNNPGNIIYSPTFSKLFGAIKSNIKQKDGSGYFAAFPSLDAGLKARETQLFGEVDGIFKSNYYNPDTSIDQALKTWSNKGYGVEIYPELKGKTLQEITPAQRKELMKRQIKRESGNMYKQLVSSGYFKNGGQQLGGQVVEMDENEIQQFLAAGGQLEFLD